MFMLPNGITSGANYNFIQTLSKKLHSKNYPDVSARMSRMQMFRISYTFWALLANMLKLISNNMLVPRWALGIETQNTTQDVNHLSHHYYTRGNWDNINKSIMIYCIKNNAENPIANATEKDGWTEIVNASKLLSTNNRHIVRVFEKQGNIEILTNKITWELIYAGLLFHVSYFIANPNEIRARNYYTAESIAKYPLILEILKNLVADPTKADVQLQQLEKEDYTALINYENLNRCFAMASNQEYEDLDKKINELERQMTFTLEDLRSKQKEYISKTEQRNIMFLKLEAKIEDNSKILSYIKKNKYIIDAIPATQNMKNQFYRNRNITGSIDTEHLIGLFVQAPLMQFDTFDLKNLTKNYTNRFALELEGTERQLYEILMPKIFLTQEYRMWISSVLVFNTKTFTTQDFTNDHKAYTNDYPNKGTDLPREIVHQFFPHPHITQQGCWGSHPDAIKAWAANSDHIGGLNQVCYMIQNLNYVDTPVVNKAYKNIKDEVLKTDAKDLIRGIENMETGNMMTVQEVFTEIAAKEGIKYNPRGVEHDEITETN
jgi:hypothetical protein